MVETKNESNSTKVDEVKLLTFSQTHQAHIAKSKLEANGIFSYLTNENTDQVAPHYQMMGLWMDLMIRKDDLDKAIEILSDGDHQKLLELQGWVFCPKCNSTHLKARTSKGKLIQFLSLLIGPFNPKTITKYQCEQCKHTFER